MTSDVSMSLMLHFAKLPDPRLERTRDHSLQDIIAIAVCATISGADGWVPIQEWAKAKEQWLRGFLQLPNGIPSHDTFGRVFSALNPEAFRSCFTAWAQDVAESLKGHVIIDGKTLRGSFDHAAGRGAIHMVSAWAREAQLVLGQVKTDEKSNEITAIPKLLSMLDLKGVTVSIDAMGCQKNIARTIVDAEADYVLALKGNQPATLEKVEEIFLAAEEQDWNGIKHSEHKTTDRAHGRVEKRAYTRIAAPQDVPELQRWPDLKSLVRVLRERTVGDKQTAELHYYLSSLPATAKEHAKYIRGHWAIENELHWSLDVHFHEDQNRIRRDNAPENAAVLRHLALSLLKQEKTAKLGVASKRLKCGWDLDYLMTVLRGPP